MSPEEIRCQALRFAIECRASSDKAAQIVDRATEFEDYISGDRVALETPEFLVSEPSRKRGRPPKQAR